MKKDVCYLGIGAKTHFDDIGATIADNTTETSLIQLGKPLQLPLPMYLLQHTILEILRVLAWRFLPTTKTLLTGYEWKTSKTESQSQLQTDGT